MTSRYPITQLAKYLENTHVTSHMHLSQQQKKQKINNIKYTPKNTPSHLKKIKIPIPKIRMQSGLRLAKRQVLSAEIRATTWPKRSRWWLGPLCPHLPDLRDDRPDPADPRRRPAGSAGWHVCRQVMRAERAIFGTPVEVIGAMALQRVTSR